MEGTVFDETEFFRSIANSGARALLIGRRALVALGLPMITGDYDYWVHVEDAAKFNAAAKPFELIPSHEPEVARTRGRYVLENDEKVDVILARFVPTVEGVRVEFDELWARRRTVKLASGVTVSIPDIPDLILTKRFGARPKDLDDIRLLEVLQAEERKP